MKVDTNDVTCVIKKESSEMTDYVAIFFFIKAIQGHLVILPAGRSHFH